MGGKGLARTLWPPCLLEMCVKAHAAYRVPLKAMPEATVLLQGPPKQTLPVSYLCREHSNCPTTVATTATTAAIATTLLPLRAQQLSRVLLRVLYAFSYLLPTTNSSTKP